MIICFDCPEDKKRQLDDAIAAGGYRDYSEFVLVAIANQLLLHSRAEASSSFVIEPMGVGTLPGTGATEPIDRSSSLATNQNIAEADLLRVTTVTGVPSLFCVPAPPWKRQRLAQPPSDIFTIGQSVPVERWIFGQYNRLLPAKASCRAIANLQQLHPDGLDLDATAAQIARAARLLGVALERKDAFHESDRDDRLAIAFPLPSNEEKGIARFANQFVGAINSHGQLSGLLASLKLIGRADTKKHRILLTDAGWNFAELKNPCIDSGWEGPAKRLSLKERQFLCDHVRRNVPQEASAFDTIIKLIEEGHATPEGLDKELKGRVSDGFDASNSFVATQRTGVISRMTDLGLVDRRRDGVRVAYVVTKPGRIFSSTEETRE